MKRFLLLASIVFLFFLSGCDNHTNVGSPDAGNNKPFTFTVHNDEDQWGRILGVYLADDGTIDTADPANGNWGRDLLGVSGTIYPEEDYTFDIYDCDKKYDIQITFEQNPNGVIPSIWAWHISMPCGKGSDWFFHPSQPEPYHHIDY